MAGRTWITLYSKAEIADFERTHKNVQVDWQNGNTTDGWQVFYDKE